VKIKDPTVTEASSTTIINIYGGYTGPNYQPYLLSPPASIMMEIDMTNPVLSFEFNIGTAFDEKNKLSTLVFSSPSLGSLDV